MLNNVNKGHGLVQSLARNLQGVTLTISSPVVCINGNAPVPLISTLIMANPPVVSVTVRDGRILTCDDATLAGILTAATSVTIVGGKLEASDQDEFVQDLADAYTIANAKADKKKLVAVHAKCLRDLAVQDLSPAEMAAWPLKLAESRAFTLSDNEVDAPMLAAEAAARQITLAELVGKVDGKSIAFAALESVISGVDGMHRDAIDELITFEEIAAYDYYTNWPPVDAS